MVRGGMEIGRYGGDAGARSECESMERGRASQGIGLGCRVGAQGIVEEGGLPGDSATTGQTPERPAAFHLRLAAQPRLPPLPVNSSACSSLRRWIRPPGLAGAIRWTPAIVRVPFFASSCFFRGFCLARSGSGLGWGARFILLHAWPGFLV